MNIRIAFLGATLAGLFLTPVARAQEPPALPLRVGEVTLQQLTAKDALDTVRGTRCKAFTLKLEAGQTYVIDMETRTKDFDPYMRLKDADDRQLSSDDDGGEGFNSRIIFVCARAGVYTLIATTYASDLGDFTLALRTPQEIKGSWRLPKETLTTEGRDARITDPPGRSYPVRLQQGKTYVIRMKSTAGAIRPVLRLKDQSGFLNMSDENNRGAGEARLEFLCAQTDTYVILATTADGLGHFELEVSEK